MKKSHLFLLILFISKFVSANEFVDGFARPFRIKNTQNILITGSVLTASMIYIDRDFDSHNQKILARHKMSSKFNDYGNNIGQIYPMLAYTAANALLAYTKEDSATYKRRAIDMASVEIYACLISGLMKPIINETRPSGGHYSFPSGHATSSFAFASYIAMEHEWYYGVPAYLSALVVSYARVSSNFHYPHDIVFGATIGMSYGLAQYYKHHSDNLSFLPMLMPADDGHGIKLLAIKEF